MIDRQRLVRRHNVVLSEWHPSSTLSVGNGDFACNVDVTGLQTFPAEHELLPRPTLVADEQGNRHLPERPFQRDDFPVPLRIQSSWGWYSTDPGEQYSLDQASSDYQSARGVVRYADQLHLNADGSPPDSAGGWLYANPRRLDLGRLGLRIGRAGAPGGGVTLSDLSRTSVELDLYSGSIHSRFEVLGTTVEVWTVAHPDRDVVATRVRSDLLARGALSIELTFPPQRDPLGGRERLHDRTELGGGFGGRPGPPAVRRTVGDGTYVVTLETDGKVRSSGSALSVGTSGDSLSLSVAFGPGTGPDDDVPAFEAVRAAAETHWRDFWSSGAAVEFAGSTDPRAHELERRVVLSQYLTAVHCSGSLPPQESGLVHNSWGGKFHLEMHWWHAAHFALWGRPALLERSLGWYRSIMPKARLAAQCQGYLGVRWPKQVGPEGRESPSTIGSFIVWQQPHPIYFAELLWLNSGDPTVLDRYRDIVFATAEFMADFPDCVDGTYHLGPPLVPAQESYYADRAHTSDPTFELAYWYWGLHVAQQWRSRLGLPPCAQWDQVMANLARPRVEDGTYAGVAQPRREVRQDHPSMLMALGFVPQTPLIEPDLVEATLDEVLARWDLGTTWGWDYPTLAMCATKLGRPATALDALMLDTYKNHYLASGHVPQFPGGLSVYLPANGGLLAAVAMMVGGWQGAEATLPGFPDDGSWRVAHEGFGVYPPDLGLPGGSLAEASAGTRGREWP
jgi:hypothetical protein